ncbi:hypothetical protein [Nesterenkonia flava]|uniref:HNH endonuclease n=2 Tax=Nesterenkonia flava TaxID=469799 RepID=A0ABU1FRY8_9MICC|nr:hypothetical protein [Nesterenkonia flava]MDR5711430.1 hypothetical protein [Nesterenkonia flava]
MAEQNERLGTHDRRPTEIEEWRANNEQRARLKALKAQRHLDRLSTGLCGMHPTEHAALLHAERRKLEHYEARADYWATWTPEQG